MFRTVLSFAFLIAVIATTSTVTSAETENENCAKSANCEKGQCASACTGEACAKSTCESKSCPDAAKLCSTETADEAAAAGCCASGAKCCATEKKLCASEDKCCADESKCCVGEACAGLLATISDCCTDNKACEKEACENNTFVATLPWLFSFSATQECDADAACNKTACAEKGNKTSCCDSKQKTACCALDELASETKSDDCCAERPAFVALSAPPAECPFETETRCCPESEGNFHQQIVALHSALAAEKTKNALLAAEVKHAEELAKAHIKFSEKMLEKEIEVAHLHTELQLSELRSEAKREITEAVFEFKHAKSSLELVSKQSEQLKQELAKRQSVHAEALAVSKAANDSLVKRVAELEKQLESLNTQLARQATAIEIH